jgi:hypothetical protein
MPTIYAFLEKDMPRIDIEVENPFFSEGRSRRRFAELLAELEREYDHMAEFVAGLSEDQLSRMAHMPILKESPWGEYPTLAQWIQAIGGYHLGSHTDHMREILEALGIESGIPRKQVSPEAHTVSPSNNP